MSTVQFSSLQSKN